MFVDDELKELYKMGLELAEIPCNDDGDEIEYDENGKEYIVEKVEDMACRERGMRWNGKCWVHTQKSRVSDGGI